MSRSLQGYEARAAELDRVAVMERPEGVLRARGGTQIDDSAGPIPELEMAGEEVGVQMCQKHVCDAQPMPRGERHIAVDVALGVDDGGDPRLLVADQIGGVCQAIEVELLQDH